MLCCACCLAAQNAKPAASLAGEGKKIALPSGGYFTWQFAQKPKMGTAILKIRAYSKTGEKDASCKISAEYGMPEMRAHDSGAVNFRLSKKGDYLLPVEIAMPGKWRVTIHIRQSGKEIFSGAIDFDV